jgi:hypothetical protein
MESTEKGSEFQLRARLAVAQAALLEAQTRALRLERRVAQLEREHTIALQVIDEESRARHSCLSQEIARLQSALQSALSSRWWRLGNKVRGLMRRVKRGLRV